MREQNERLNSESSSTCCINDDNDSMMSDPESEWRPELDIRPEAEQERLVTQTVDVVN